MCDFRDADELVPLLQIQQHGCRSQKCVPPARSFHFDHPVLNQKKWIRILPLPASRDPAVVRPRGRILDDHPILRTVVELVAPLRRFVLYVSFQPHPLAPLWIWLIWCCAWTALTFVVAPLPNVLFSHCGGEDFSADYAEGSGPIDLGRFITAFIVVTGFALPLVLAHSEIIKPGASIMSLIGGGYVRSCSAPSVLHG